MRASILATIGLLAALLAPASARAAFVELPEIAQRMAIAMVRACEAAGGRPVDPMTAIERVDVDHDGTPDAILDENRFDCRGRPSLHCNAMGCKTHVVLSDRGRWRYAFDVVGSYCIEREGDRARFVTIQRNFLADGRVTYVNARYRFRGGRYFPDGAGRC